MLRSIIRLDTGASAVEMEHGRTLHLPSDFYIMILNNYSSVYQCINKIRHAVNYLKPVPISHVNLKNLFVNHDLENSEYVFIRNDAVKKPFQVTYDGLYRVIKRNKKVIALQLPNRGK